MRKHKDLLHRLIPILLMLVLTVVLTQAFFQQMISSSTQKCWDELSMVRSEVSREISTRLSGNIQMLTLASDAIMLNVDFGDEGTVLAYLASVKKETLFDRIDVIFPDGTILVETGERVPDRGEKTYQELIAKGAHISQRVPDFYTGKESIHIFAPVCSPAGNPIAILGATVHCSTLAETFISVHYGTDAQLYLVDLRDGNFVLNSTYPTLGNLYTIGTWEMADKSEASDVTANIMAGKTDQVAFISPDNGKTSYLAYAPVADTNFALGLVIQDDVVLADVAEMRNTLMRVGLVEVALLLVFSLWTYASIRKSIQNENRAQEAELELLHQKEQLLQTQYAVAADRREFLEIMALNLPGGYHRCTTDHGFQLSFISSSFTEVTGYTQQQLQDELAGSYMGIVAPEDREYFMSLAPQLERDGQIQCSYRIRRRDGVLRWVKDSTQYIERDGEQYYQCTLADITEQIEALEHARQEAEASSQAKSTFLFNISHDIRTPMNAIQGFSHMIAQNADNAELVKTTIGKIQQACQSLMLLMDDVLDISRIERGKEDLNLQPLDLFEHGRNLYEMFAADMKNAGITFVGSGDDLHDHVYCDQLKLTRIMMNMLSNARKFTPAGGTVTFGATRLRRDEKTCTYRFFVQDTGIGMSPEFQKRAFEQFERERTSTQSGISGSGLGLAIIKMLAELMGGTVELKSELGQGTEIAAILTFHLADQEQTQQTSLPQQDVSDMTGKRVLLVEDNEFNREIARYILESLHCIVEEAENGAVCIEKLRSGGSGFYDLILMDIQMPVMDGYTATIEIRNLADKQLAAIPIVAMTANAFDDDRHRCLELGMNGHIGKPFDVAGLMQTLSSVF